MLLLVGMLLLLGRVGRRPKVRKTRACEAGPGKAGVVDLCRCSSAAPLVICKSG